MADYPGALNVNLSSVDQENAASFEVGPGETVKVSARFPKSSWGQAVILHNVLNGAQYLLDPPVYVVGDASLSSGFVADSGNHLLSAWAWYGGDINGNPGPNVWKQVPLANLTPPVSSAPSLGAAVFFGPLVPREAPGPAGNVAVSWVAIPEINS